MLEEQLDPDPNSVANVSKTPPSYDTNGVEYEVDDRGNGTSVGIESDCTTNESKSVIEIEDFFDDEAVIKVVETEPTDDTSAVANAHEIGNDTISIQNPSDKYDSNNG